MKILFISIILFALSCVDPWPFDFSHKGEMVPYIIEAGEHRSKNENKFLLKGVKLSPLGSRTLLWAGRFGAGTRYDLKNKDQADWNKMYGMMCGMKVHKHSVRIGWRWDTTEKKIEICIYYYNEDSDRFQTIKVGYVDQFKSIEYAIHSSKNKYWRVEIEGFTHYIIPSHTKCKWINGRFRLFPYFGGNQRAPHDMIVWIREHRR